MTVASNFVVISIVLGTALLSCWVMGLFLTARLSDSQSVRSSSGLILTGLGAWLAIAYSAHLFVPIKGWSFRLMAISIVAALIFWFLRFQHPMRRSCFKKIRPLVFVSTAVMSIVLIFALARAMFVAPSNYDSFLYHFQLVEYYSTEKVVVGLGNLHTRLGFTSSVYPLASIFENSPWGSNGFRFANAFLVIVAIIEFYHRARSLFSTQSLRSALPAVIGIPVILTVAFSQPGNFLSSPSPDISASLLGLIAFGYFLDALDRRTSMNTLFTLIVSSIAFSFRPINVVVFFLSLILAAGLFRKCPPGKRKKEIAVVIPGLFLLFSFMFHSILITGYPAYPVPFLKSPLPWAVPKNLVENDLRWIESWAKTPGQAPDGVLGNWSWVGEWWVRNQSQLGIWFTVFLASLGVGVLNCRESFFKILRSERVVIFAAAAPLILWFLKGPDPRFGFGQIAIFAVLPLLLIREETSSLRKSPGNHSILALGFGMVLLAQFFYGNLITVGDERFFEGVDSSINEQTLSEFPTVVYRVTSNLSLRTTQEGADQCGRVKWCTPYPSDELWYGRRWGWDIFALP